MKIAVGSDHAGFEPPPPLYKPEIIRHLETLGHVVVDCGTLDAESVDYPDFAERVCQEVLLGTADRGVLICGTGMGIAMAANRFKGIRAAPVCSVEAATLSRTHNDSNVICLGRRLLSLADCISLLDIWLTTEFSRGPRHERRILKMG